MTVSRQHIKDGHFISVKLYDLEQEIIVAANHPDALPIEEKIKRHRLDVARLDGDHFRQFYGAGGQILVVAQIPLKTAGGKLEGYFEGVYKADFQTMTEMKNRIFFALLQVVLIIFFTALAVYPIFLSLNKGLIGMTGELFHANIGTLKVLGSAIAKRDSDTNIHNYRVTIYAVRLAEADVFDALTSQRPYKEPFSLEEAMRILMKERGRHFDPSLIDSFAGIAGGLYEEISKAGDNLLEAVLDELIDRYFSAELPVFDSGNHDPARR
ncbi:MAG: hypothetical protein K0B01_05490 [Syntrophobacterales bacterium]|nr:hypothetical protein [Syntrophobacterales bacterium]